MERILETHVFGPHQARILERADDEGTSWFVLIDGVVITDPPLSCLPCLEDVVRLYAAWTSQMRSSSAVATAARGRR